MPIRLPNYSWGSHVLPLCFLTMFILLAYAAVPRQKYIYTMLEVWSFSELENLHRCLAQPSSNFYEVTSLKSGLNF